MQRSFLTLLGAIVAVACGGAATPAGPTSPAATITATPPQAATTGPAATSEDGLTFTVSSGEATVAVREQLANLQAPSDAILTTTGVRGSFTLKEDGTFAEGSLIEVDLTSLQSDRSQRDGFVKRNTLRTSEFPVATLVPTKAEGLTLPLADGPFELTLTGKLTIAGTTKEVTWDVTGERSGDTIKVTATSAPAWKFADFGLEVPRVFSVLSIVDEIRLTVKLEATAG